MEIKGKERSEVNAIYKWDLTIMYKDNNEWKVEFDQLSEDICSFVNFKGDLTANSDKLLNALQEYARLSRIYEKLSSYAVRKSDEDTRDNCNIQLKNKMISLGTEFSEITSFFNPELLKNLSNRKLKSFLKENQDLRVYEHYLNNLFRFKNHTLTSNEEMIIASASDVLSVPSLTFTQLNNADIKFENIEDEDGNIAELTKGNYSKYIASQDRRVRQESFHTLYKEYSNLKNTFTETIVGNIKAGYFLSKNRKYSNPLEMSLYANNIDFKVYDNVIKTVSNNLDKMHKYVKMKKDILDLDEFHMYDFYVDLIKEYDVEYKYEDALELIFKALEPMGQEYITNAKKIFSEHWIDVYENNGKLAGAYSSYGYDTPPYILINYNGKLNSVSTIIHELGHSMHTFYSASHQAFINYQYPIFLAEIASNVNEMLLNMYMLDHASETQEKLSLINSFLESVKGSIYRQTMFAEFEKNIYELEGNKKGLTEETISDLYYKLNKKYYGDEIISDDEIRYEWMRIPHFYYQFYVYQYATGLAAAFFIAQNLYQGKKGFRDQYIEFLSSGDSDYPLELLKRLGIDITSDAPINSILEYFDKQIDEFIKLYEKQA